MDALLSNDRNFKASVNIFTAIRKQVFENLCSTCICPPFKNMSDVDKMQFILCNKEYDINVVCISKIYSMYSERNVLSYTTV